MENLFDLLTTEGFVFEEAAKYFGDKIPVTPSEFYKLADEHRTRAFTVSGYSKIQVLKKFHDELQKAIEEGTTKDEFRNRMNDFLANKGYEGVTNYQADNIFRMNTQTAYQVGHYSQMTSPDVMKLRPYWQYDAVNDQHTRPSHMAMDGKVFRADDPIWDIWYPPNGFGCRCGVNTLSERQVRERGFTVETEVPRAAEVDGKFVNILPDRDFRTNPAKRAFTPDLEGYPDSMKNAFYSREQSNGKKSV